MNAHRISGRYIGELEKIEAAHKGVNDNVFSLACTHAKQCRSHNEAIEDGDEGRLLDLAPRMKLTKGELAAALKRVAQ